MLEENYSEEIENAEEIATEETAVSGSEIIETTFGQFGLSEGIMKGIRECGFKEPSPIQKQAIPLILEGKDIIGQAHTGTGKTAAFGLPAMSNMKLDGSVEILVITPTRELAMQVSDELYRFGKYDNISTTTVYGGQSYARQYERIRKGTPIVVGTPGRLLDIISGGNLDNFTPSIVILDEADEMLDMGFMEDIQSIFEHLPEERQTLLFSATMPDGIRRLAKRILKDPVEVSVMGDAKKPLDIKQKYYIIEERERDAAVIRLIDSFEPTKSIIFCRTKKEVERMNTLLIGRGYSARGLHGDMEQHQREEVISAFRDGRIYNLIATDVAARGLDVKDVTHVFNYHMPFDPESYIHRIGRTGRAGKSGVAVTLVTPQEFRGIQKISRITGNEIEQAFVPTLYEMKDEKLKKLATNIVECEIDEKAYDLLEQLYTMDSSAEITYKLITMLLKEQEFYGPKMIGLSQKRVERMLEEEKEFSKSRRRDGGRRDGRSGGGRRDGRSGGGRSRDGGRDFGSRDGRSRDGGEGRSEGRRDFGGSRDGGAGRSEGGRGDGRSRDAGRGGEGRRDFGGSRDGGAGRSEGGRDAGRSRDAGRGGEGRREGGSRDGGAGRSEGGRGDGRSRDAGRGGEGRREGGSRDGGAGRSEGGRGDGRSRDAGRSRDGGRGGEGRSEGRREGGRSFERKDYGRSR